MTKTAPSGRIVSIGPQLSKRAMGAIPGTKTTLAHTALAGIGVSPMDWQERESAKFADGTYLRPPWYGEAWAQTSEILAHFAHVSEDDTSKIAYTPDDRFGREDRQLRTRPGKYLRKYLKDALTDSEIQEWAGRFAAANEKCELQLAKTPDEIERIYTESGRDSGVAACMSREADHFDGTCHPCRVYGAGDLAIGFIGTYAHPRARALVRLDPKVYSRIYGDAARMRAALDAAGFTPDSGRDFDGAKLLKIEFGSQGLVGPYIDGYSVSDRGDHLIMLRGGEIGAGETNGTLRGGFEYHCADCGEGLDSEDVFYACDDPYCETCYCESFCSCEDCGESVRNDDIVEFADHYYCEYCADEKSTTCEKCGEREAKDQTIEVSGEDWCRKCWENHAVSCDRCEEYFDTSCETFEEVDDSDTHWCEDCVKRYALECHECQSLVSEEEGLSDSGKCQGCQAEEDAESEADQLSLFGDTGQLSPGPGLVWIPAMSKGSLWGDAVFDAAGQLRHTRSGAVTLWGVSEDPIGELLPCCICGKVQLECNTNYHQG